MTELGAGMVRVVASLAGIAAFAIGAGSWMLTDAAHARWEERVERQCTNHQVCRPVQKTQQDCRVEQVCRQQPQPTSQCQMQNVCQPVTRMVQVCQPVTNCVQGRCMTTQQCQNVAQQQQVCQPRQVCQQVMVNAPKCAPQQRCQPKVVTTQECANQPQCQNVVKRVWVPDPAQPPPAAENRLPSPAPAQPLPPPAAGVRAPAPAAVHAVPPPHSPQRSNDLQAYKKQLEERLKSQQAVKHTHDQLKRDEPRRARLSERKLAEQHRQERRAALLREIEWRQAQLARLKARRERARTGASSAPGPQVGQEQAEHEDGASRLAEIQSALEQLIAALSQTEEQDEQDESQEASNEQPGTEPAAEAGPGGQWSSVPRAGD